MALNFFTSTCDYVLLLLACKHELFSFILRGKSKICRRREINSELFVSVVFTMAFNLFYFL